MVNQEAAQKFVKQGLTFDDVLLIPAASDVLPADIDLRTRLTRRTLHVVPMLNPDGIELAVHGLRADDPDYPRLCFYNDGSDDFSRWQSNYRGVDLNHNFDAGFAEGKALEPQNGIYGPGPTRFGGKAPFSEPETAALRGYVEKHGFFSVYAFHSQGEEIYYDYNGHTPEHGLEMARILAKVSGYKVEKVEGITSCRGFKDWFIQTFQRPGFTIEAGLGKNPLPPSDLPALYQRLEPMLVAALELPIPVSSVS